MTRLFPVLGDQLSQSLPSLARARRDRGVILMMEVREEAVTPRHHKKKIAFIFSAMRHFAQELRTAGWNVDYVKLDDPANTHSFAGEIERACHRHGTRSIIATWPGEYRVMRVLQHLGAKLEENTRFLFTRDDFAARALECFTLCRLWPWPRVRLCARRSGWCVPASHGLRLTQD